MVREEATLDLAWGLPQGRYRRSQVQMGEGVPTLAVGYTSQGRYPAARTFLMGVPTLAGGYPKPSVPPSNVLGVPPAKVVTPRPRTCSDGGRYLPLNVSRQKDLYCW